LSLPRIFRDTGQYPEAIEYARQAQELVPNHSVAALCVASVFEVTNQPVDSLIMAYSQALAGDPRLASTQRRLGQLHLQNGDTASANLFLTEDLDREPSNANLRAFVALNWIAVGEPDSVYTILSRGTYTESEMLDLYRLISGRCLDKEMWGCGFEALKGQYRLDPNVRADTTFYYQIVGAAQNLGDPDAVLEWTLEGIRNLARSWDAQDAVRALWMAHAGALLDTGQRDVAVTVYFDVYRGDSSDIRPVFAAAEALVDTRFLGIDSATPLDTAALWKADSLLATLAQRRDDDDVLQTIAIIYFTPAAALVRGRVAPELASVWLEKALSYDVDGRIYETANSLNGLALSEVVQQLDAAIREDPTCDLVNRAQETITRARAATLAGQNAFPDVARQVLEGLDAYEVFIPQYREILQCGG
jgi:tetratricopeptide (TPR) repeat protein